ncbi:MAG: hypothetical protein CMA72_07495 [Euryarchaeota archaeon]|nr:hypothetical protein [Euryarchaeota archaeon]
MSRTWVDNVEIGDLVFSKQDNKPAIVLDKMETGKSQYGQLANRRLRFRIYIDDDEGWLSETSFRALYKVS